VENLQAVGVLDVVTGQSTKNAGVKQGLSEREVRDSKFHFSFY